MSPKDNVAYMREWAADIRKHSGKSVDADRCDAIADEIDHLRALNAEMRQSLKDMLDWADTPSQEASPSWILGACRRARAILAETEK